MLGFSKSYADSSLYVRLAKKDNLIVLNYFDDLIIIGNNVGSIAQLKKNLQHQFPIKDLGSLKYFLCIEIATSSKGLFLNQCKYILNFLADADLQHVKPAANPLDSKLKFTSVSIMLDSPKYYQQLIGKLIYFTIMRPIISFVVSLVNQHMHSPTVYHLCLVSVSCDFLKGTIGRGTVMTRNGHINIMGYSDSNWVGNALDRRSTIGYCTLVGSNLVSCKSKK